MVTYVKASAPPLPAQVRGVEVPADLFCGMPLHCLTGAASAVPEEISSLYNCAAADPNMKSPVVPSVRVK
jgi:hypothetical protein